MTTPVPEPVARGAVERIVTERDKDGMIVRTVERPIIEKPVVPEGKVVGCVQAGIEFRFDMVITVPTDFEGYTANEWHAVQQAYAKFLARCYPTVDRVNGKVWVSYREQTAND